MTAPRLESTPTPRSLALGQAAGRVVFGAALMLAPRAVAGPWIGARVVRPTGATVVIAAMGARDLGLGLGTARAITQGSGAGTWIAASALADATDFAATWRARGDLPTLSAYGVAAMAGASTLLGLWLRSKFD